MVRLEERFHRQFFVGRNTKELLEEQGIGRISALSWWEEAPPWPGSATVSFVPAQHESGRLIIDYNPRLWGGSSPAVNPGPIYFAGDTGFGPHFQQIRKRFGPMSLARLPIGAYLPRELGATSHVDPFESLTAHHILGSQLSLGIHHGTFKPTMLPRVRERVPSTTSARNSGPRYVLDSRFAK